MQTQQQYGTVSDDEAAASNFKKMLMVQNYLVHESKQLLNWLDCHDNPVLMKKQLKLGAADNLDRFEEDCKTYYVKLRQFYAAVHSGDDLRNFDLDELRERVALVTHLKEAAWSEAEQCIANLSRGLASKEMSKTYNKAYRPPSEQLLKNFKYFKQYAGLIE
jgi:hypothetical protein